MKRILSLLLFLSVLTLPITAETQAQGDSTFRLVASGTVTQTNMKISAVAATSFVDFSLADVLTSKIGHLLVIKDSSKNKIQGWIKAAGTGETVGSNVVTNGDFSTVAITYNTLIGTFASGDTVTDSVTGATGIFSSDTGTVLTLTGVSGTFTATDAITAAPSLATAVVVSQTITGWTLNNSTLTSVGDERTGGSGSQSLSVITTSTYGRAKQTFSPSLFALYYSSCWAKIMTGGTAIFGGIGGGKLTSSYSWINLTAYGVRSTSGYYIYLQGDNSATEYRFDDVSIKQVLTPSTTGVTISSTKGGTAMDNWTNKSSSFNYNDSSNYTYEIWKSTSAPVVASGSVTQANFHADLTDTNAFVELLGVDLTAYQDGRHAIGIYNVMGGYGMVGRISSTAPSGETLSGVEICDDSGFDNSGNWTKGTGWTVTGGKGIATAALDGTTCVQPKNRTIGILYKGTFTIDSITGSVSPFILSSSVLDAITTTGNKTIYYVATSTGSRNIGFYANGTLTAQFDNLSVQQVTDPPSTGARIVAGDKSTRAWIYKNASFDPNQANGQSYKIFFIGD